VAALWSFIHDDRRDTLKQLLRINDELLQLMAERKTRNGNFIPPYTAGGRPNSHSDRSRQEQTAINPLAQLTTGG
jgi:hypothetical protein